MFKKTNYFYIKVKFKRKFFKSKFFKIMSFKNEDCSNIASTYEISNQNTDNIIKFLFILSLNIFCDTKNKKALAEKDVKVIYPIDQAKVSVDLIKNLAHNLNSHFVDNPKTINDLKSFKILLTEIESRLIEWKNLIGTKKNQNQINGIENKRTKDTFEDFNKKLFIIGNLVMLKKLLIKMIKMT